MRKGEVLDQTGAQLFGGGGVRRELRRGALDVLGEEAHAKQEQRVIEPMLAVNVFVEGRRTQAHPTGDLMQAESGHSVGAHDVARGQEDRVEHLLPLAPATQRGRVEPRSISNTHRLSEYY